MNTECWKGVCEREDEGNSERDSHLFPTAQLRKALVCELKHYTRKAKPTGTELGSGTYGTVVELTLAGEIVAGKVFKPLSHKQPQMLISKLRAELFQAF